MVGHYTHRDVLSLRELYFSNFYEGTYVPNPNEVYITNCFIIWLHESDKRFLLNSVTY